MSFISKLKSPLMKRHFSLFHKDHDSYNTSNSVNDVNQLKRSLIIYYIDPTENEGTYSCAIDNNDTGDILLERVCDYYSLNDYKEYFGLKYTSTDEKGNNEILWLNPLKTIGRQLKLSNNTLTFRVKHFPANPHKIESADVRYLIFLQLKTCLQKGELQLSSNDEIQLAAYVLQSEYGDYDETIHKEQGNYIKDKKFISKKSDKSDELIVDLHKKLIGLKPEDVELKFLEQISQYNTYGAEIIIVKNKQGVLVNFGVSHRGIITYLFGQPANMSRIELYPWTQIGKISYENRSLYIHAHTPEPSNSEIIKKHTMVFKCNSERMCKHLWRFILDQRAFFTFNRGIDVPKLKSSKRIFRRVSKFRYSGRCEHEILVSQHDTSHNNSFNTSTYSTVRRRSTRQLKVNSTNDKSFTDSGLSENYVETLHKLDETTSTNTKSTNKFDTNSITAAVTTTTPVSKYEYVAQLDTANNLNDLNTKKALEIEIINDNNNGLSANKIEFPNATSTPQLKPIIANGNLNDLLYITTTNSNDLIDDKITSSNLVNNQSSSLLTKASLQNANDNNKATLTTTNNLVFNKININKVIAYHHSNGKFKNNNSNTNEILCKSYNLLRKYIFYVIIIVIILILMIDLFTDLLSSKNNSIAASNSGNNNNNNNNNNVKLYSTVKNFLYSSANSVSVSVRENLRNSRLLFDPIFSFFLRQNQ